MDQTRDATSVKNKKRFGDETVRMPTFDELNRAANVLEDLAEHSSDVTTNLSAYKTCAAFLRAFASPPPVPAPDLRAPNMHGVGIK